MQDLHSQAVAKVCALKLLTVMSDIYIYLTNGLNLYTLQENRSLARKFNEEK